MSTYYEKLRDPRWQMRRLEVMKMYSASCAYCDATDKTLNIHHVNYKRGVNPWDYDDGELVCLCEDCHDALEDAKRMVNSTLGGLSDNYWPKLWEAINTIWKMSSGYDTLHDNLDAWLKSASKFGDAKRKK